MGSENLSKIKSGIICGASFIIVSFLVFRTDLPKIPTIFLYNLIIIMSLQDLGYYRGLFFLGASIFLTILISLAMNFHYVWGVPIFFVTFLIVDDRIKKHDYTRYITETRIEELSKSTELLINEHLRHKREAAFLEKKEKRFNLLKDATDSLGSTLSLDDVSEIILDNALSIVGKSGSALLFLVDTEKQELNLAASRIGKDLDKVKSKKGDLLDNWVFKHRQSLLTEDIRKDFRFSEETKGVFRSVISSPLIERKKVVGIVRLEHSKPYAYTSEDLRLLCILCDLGAASLGNARLYQQMLTPDS
ncbi:MAG: GAF domain-containing protein [Candidatus Omnitrophica bacterium]|nr:GAF domain-containing protein [Candidatus Omnitrophota bacterium]